ncbi:MAG TPA: hypothetical protein VD967_03505 [Candidatus Paceibacterota bacterium]|nr:hypothetical protein [Candidatus Paceibacterota bacterium]
MHSIALFRFEYRKQAFFALAILAGMLVGTYLFLLNQTIRDVVAVEDTERAVATLHSEVSDLERQYLIARSKVNLETASVLGFQDAPRVDFLARGGERTRLTLVNQGSSE